MKITLLFCWFFFISYNSYAQCPNGFAGQLSGSMSYISITDSTNTPVYTVTPTGLPNTEFLIIQNDSMASDGLGARILTSSPTGRVSPSSFGLATCNEICVLPFSYNLSQLQAIVDSLLFGTFDVGTSCCDAADVFFPSTCNNLIALGINSGADVTNLNDIIALLGVFAGTTGGSSSVESLTFTIDQLNQVTGLFGDCAAGVTEICYQTNNSTAAKDCYTVVAANAANSVNIVSDTIIVAFGSSTTLSANFFPNTALDSIIWSIDGNSTTTINPSTGELIAGQQVETISVIAKLVHGCASDTVVIIVQPIVGLVYSKLEPSSLQVFPNPFEHRLQVQFETQSPGDYSIQLVAVTGQIHYQKNYNLSMGKQFVELSTDKIPAGYYFLRIIGEKTQAVQSVIKY